jgi:hypothetical protein
VIRITVKYRGKTTNVIIAGEDCHLVAQWVQDIMRHIPNKL